MQSKVQKKSYSSILFSDRHVKISGVASYSKVPEDASEASKIQKSPLAKCFTSKSYFPPLKLFPR